LLLLTGCLGKAALSIPEGDTAPPSADTASSGSGFTQGPIEQPLDTGATAPTGADPYANALLRIASPGAGTIWRIADTVPLRAEIISPIGDVLEPTEIAWTTDRDPAWVGTGAAIDVPLAVGDHRLTARTRLPDGTGLAFSVGDVRVQSPFTGTYAGLFQVDLETLGLTFSCSGSSTVVVGPWGQLGTGTGSCLLSILILDLDLPLSYVFDLDIDVDGTVVGEAGVEILLITYNFPAESTLDPEGRGFDLTFAGDIPLLGPIDATVAAPRVSLDYE
jgi:hypothetical protein